MGLQKFRNTIPASLEICCISPPYYFKFLFKAGIETRYEFNKVNPHISKEPLIVFFYERCTLSRIAI